MVTSGKIVTSDPKADEGRICACMKMHRGRRSCRSADNVDAIRGETKLSECFAPSASLSVVKEEYIVPMASKSTLAMGFVIGLSSRQVTQICRAEPVSFRAVMELPKVRST